MKKVMYDAHDQDIYLFKKMPPSNLKESPPN